MISMMLDIIVYILVFVVVVQSIYLYLLTKFFRNIIRVASEEKGTFKIKHESDSLPIDYKSVPAQFESKNLKLGSFLKENTEVSFVFLSTTCATCKDIINNFDSLPPNVYFVLSSPPSLDIGSITVVSPEAFDAFDIETTPTLVSLSADNSIFKSVVYSTDDLLFHLSKKSQSKKSS